MKFWPVQTLLALVALSTQQSFATIQIDSKFGALPVTGCDSLIEVSKTFNAAHLNKGSIYANNGLSSFEWSFSDSHRRFEYTVISHTATGVPTHKIKGIFRLAESIADLERRIKNPMLLISPEHNVLVFQYIVGHAMVFDLRTNTRNVVSVLNIPDTIKKVELNEKASFTIAFENGSELTL